MSGNKLQNVLTKDILEYEYKICGSMQKMADKLSVSIDSIYKYMKIYNIYYDKHNTCTYSCNEFFFSNDNEESFYWAGFIAADGSLQKRKYSKILKIALSNKDTDHINKFKTLINSNHPIKIYNVKPSKLVKIKQQSAEIQIVSEQIFNDLARFNIVPNKTKIYNMPDWLLTHPLVNHFMRGYFDGDGSASYCGLNKGRTIKQLNFSILGTEKFIQQYRSILVRNCNINNAKITKHYSVYKISYSGNNVVKYIYNFLYKDYSICLNRKHKKF